MNMDRLSAAADWALLHPWIAGAVAAAALVVMSTAKFAALDARRARAAREDAAALLARAAATYGEASGGIATARAILADAKEYHAGTAAHLDQAREHLQNCYRLAGDRAVVYGLTEGDANVPAWAVGWAAQAWTTETTRDIAMDERLAFAFARMLARAVGFGPPPELVDALGIGAAQDGAS